MKLTKKQADALSAAFTKGGAHYGRRGSCMGGAYRRMCERMAEAGLVSDSAPFGITVRGLVVLRDHRSNRYAQQGTMAQLLDLQAVEDALKEVPNLAALAERRLAA